ncbi:hypothetical protein EYC84_010226 [Monilinia fructicola]|nr:hypothetical protein EYC84_010226 [Monilinia fructicola]
MGVQIPFIAVQVVLNAKDMPSGNAIAIFFNSLGGAIAISIAQNVFINPGLVYQAGATHLRDVISPADLAGVLLAYCKSLDDSFVLSIAVGGIATICACFVEWGSVKGKKIDHGAALFASRSTFWVVVILKSDNGPKKDGLQLAYRMVWYERGVKRKNGEWRS